MQVLFLLTLFHKWQKARLAQRHPLHYPDSSPGLLMSHFLSLPVGAAG